jgi:GTP pyrophosphokinase
MVSVQNAPPFQAAQDYADIHSWLDSLAKPFAPPDAGVIIRAWDLAAPLYDGKTGLNGAPLMRHALGTASILATMNMDHETVAAAILHAVPEYSEGWAETLNTRFGPGIAGLVEGIARMERIREFSETESLREEERKKGGHAQQAESLRKMLLAMVEDIRVVLIKLAERTQTMRGLAGATPDVQKQVARETRSLFAPLANRLGVWQLKWELEDLALRYLEPDLYKEMARLLDERRVERERYIADVMAQLRQELEQAGIRAEVTGRPKHIYSILNKMRRKQVAFGEVYDVRAVRVLVDDIKDCYAVLGLVHNLWQPLPREFDDYIAHPKSNNYRSLHTSVTGPQGLALEVQIRTFEMHQHSELGVAAHWRYKEGGKTDVRFDERIAWLRQVLEWKSEITGSSGMLEHFRSELFQDQVYVFTPLGKVIDLPRGATPVDFAYAVHTGLGHRTRGAKVDGSIVPLNYPLQNGQCVEILAAKQDAPSRDWLSPSLGYLHSSRARAKVRQWFKHQTHGEDAAQGRVQLERELHRLGAVSINQEKLAQKLHFQNLEDFLAAIGRGDVTQRQIALAIQEELPAKTGRPAQPLNPRPAVARASPMGVLVEGVGNLLTSLAKCCKPVPPDAIAGYVTRDRGVTIHRKDCPSLAHLPETRRARLLAAQWGAGNGGACIADLEVKAHDRQGLLRDITSLFARENVNVTKVDSQSKGGHAAMRFSIEVTGMEQLSRLLALVQHVPSVISARRGND